MINQKIIEASENGFNFIENLPEGKTIDDIKTFISSLPYTNHLPAYVKNTIQNRKDILSAGYTF